MKDLISKKIVEQIIEKRARLVHGQGSIFSNILSWPWKQFNLATFIFHTTLALLVVFAGFLRGLREIEKSKTAFAQLTSHQRKHMRCYRCTLEVRVTLKEQINSVLLFPSFLMFLQQIVKTGNSRFISNSFSCNTCTLGRLGKTLWWLHDLQTSEKNTSGQIVWRLANKGWLLCEVCEWSVCDSLCKKSSEIQYSSFIYFSNSYIGIQRSLCRKAERPVKW